MDLMRIATAALARRTVATIATVSPAGRPHAAVVQYAATGDPLAPVLWSSTDLDSRKARNIAANPYVGVTVAFQRLPLIPPATVQFQGRAEIVDVDDPELRELARTGAIKAVTGHGELDRPGVCFLKIVPGRRLHTYALGMSIVALVRDPLNAARTVELPVRAA